MTDLPTENSNHGCAIWLTGIPASGKSTIGRGLACALRNQGLAVEHLDGDELRQALSPDLGYSDSDRELHNRRVVYLSKLLVRNGVNVVISVIAPFRSVRAFAREELELFLEVWVKCSVEECIRRDPKGLYQRALRGEITNLTGLQAPYEEPEHPDVLVDTEAHDVETSVDIVLQGAAARGFIPEQAGTGR